METAVGDNVAISKVCSVCLTYDIFTKDGSASKTDKMAGGFWKGREIMISFLYRHFPPSFLLGAKVKQPLERNDANNNNCMKTLSWKS